MTGEPPAPTADVPASDDRRRGTARVTTVVGALLALGALAFVARSLVADRREIADALGGASYGWLVLASVLAAVGMSAIALPWRRALHLLGDDMPAREVLGRYYVGEIGKYLPGGVWPILGRGELAVRWGVSRAAAYGSVLLSLVALYLAAALVVAAGLPVLLAGDDGTGPIAIVVLLPLGLIALHPAILGRVQRLGERVLRRTLELPTPAWGASVGLVVRYLPAWVAIGGATWAVARALDPSAGVLDVGVATALSWLVGFALIPVPGGVGVREAAFVAAAGSLDPGIAAAVAVGARALFVAVDGIGALLGSAALRRGARDASP